MSAVDVVSARRGEREFRIAEALRAEWRMIASVSLRPCGDGDGFEAEVCLDPVVVRAAAMEQGNPGTTDALAATEARRHAAIDGCVQRVNDRLADVDRIRAFSVVG